MKVTLGTNSYETNTITAHDDDGNEIAELSFHKWFQRPDTTELSSLRVRSGNQKRGIGTAVLRKWKTWAMRNMRLKYVYANTVSQASLKAMVKVFGQPVFLSDGIRLFSLKEALSKLPEKYEFKGSDYGEIQASGMDAIFCLSRHHCHPTQWDEQMKAVEK
jgi:hypothetical protein